MTDNDIDFEELDRAISALMENQDISEASLDGLASSQVVESVDDVVVRDDFEASKLVKAPKATSTEAVIHTSKINQTADIPAATVEIKQRQSTGLDVDSNEKPSLNLASEPRAAFEVHRFDVPDRPESITLETKTSVTTPFDRKIEQMAEAAVASFQKETAKSTTETDQPAPIEQDSLVKQTAPNVSNFATKSTTERPESSPITSSVVEAAKAVAVKKPVLPIRRGKYMDFVPSDAASNPKKLSLTELLARKRQRAAAINRATASQSAMSDIKPPVKPVSSSQSVDFEINLPAEPDAPAVEVKGNYQTSHTTTQTNSGDTVTIKRETVNYVATPVEKSVPSQDLVKTKSSDQQTESELAKSSGQKPAVANQLSPATQAPEKVDSDDSVRKSPFLAEAKVKKRPLGQPEPLLSSPAVTMKVPERIKTYDTDSQAALYRAELHQNLPEEKSSKLWLVLMIVIILIIAGIVYYFWGDLKTLFL